MKLSHRKRTTAPASLTLIKLGHIVVALSILLGASLFHRANTLASHLSAFLNEEEKVTPKVSANNETWRIEWRIDQPNVKQHITQYQQIWFQPGDRVTIQAGGCVQTGGHGKTWKRYVDPSGPNADRLYHGLISIPSVTGVPAATGAPPDLKRIAGYVNHTRLVPSGVKTAGLFLSLGYEDDDYSDNGYWGHDDGTGDQCKGFGNAFVIITIERACPKAVLMSVWRARTRPTATISIKSLMELTCCQLEGPLPAATVVHVATTPTKHAR